MMDTLEGNKLIAEFMGAVYDGRKYWKFPNGDTYIHSPEYNSQFIYHTSWDWLMPVVEKIGELSPYIIHERGMRISDAGITYKSPVSLIDAVWNGVTLYIQWYNKNKKQ